MKNDSVVQTWCKRTTLASLVLWYDKQGERFRSLSELVRASLEGMEEIIRQSGEIVVENIDEAEEILKAFKLRNLNPGGKGRRNLYNNLAKASSLGTSKEIENAREIRKIIEEKNESELVKIDDIVKQQVEKWKKKKERISDASKEINLHEYEKKEKEELNKIKKAFLIPPGAL